MVFKNKVFKLEIMKESEKIYKEIEYKNGVFAMFCINDVDNPIEKQIENKNNS